MKQWNIIETFIEKIKFLNLPLGKYTVFGSGPMAARGLKEANDIDILVTLDLWNTLSKTMKQEKSKLSNTPFLVYNKDNTITFWKDMYPGKWDIDKLIKTSDIIDGVPFVKLTEVYRWKKMMNRDKDKNDMLLIEKYLNRVKQ